MLCVCGCVVFCFPHVFGCFVCGLLCDAVWYVFCVLLCDCVCLIRLSVCVRV